ncbi:MAG: deoxyribose-phosphate aldolase [Brumimicrobium sp.]|nr:deoxyribose-phosphate aldolase [Brumimicrobium sp.]MCO5267692.1 deoxyribose-phosphate aldolase [Brumimicrobium sp.]
MWTKREICSFIDLTSLNSYDSPTSIRAFIQQAIDYDKQGFSVAAVCVFPNFAPLVIDLLQESSIKVAVVAGNFPNSQGFLTTKIHECGLVLDAGVDEVDIVLNLGAFDEGDYEQVVSEVRAFKGIMPNQTLKVILETGYLKTPERIQKACELAIAGGADFLKTSTGKEYPGACIEAAEVMAKAISGSAKKVGLKISGGVKTYEDAVKYCEAVEKHLGKNFMTPKTFRIGASSLIKDLMRELV